MGSIAVVKRSGRGPGMAFRIEDVVQGAAELKAAGGTVLKEPESTEDEPAHLAMCADPEGNEIMLTQKRG